MKGSIQFLPKRDRQKYPRKNKLKLRRNTIYRKGIYVAKQALPKVSRRHDP